MKVFDKEYHRQWRKNNPNKKRKHNQKWSKNNPNYSGKYSANYRERNPWIVTYDNARKRCLNHKYDRFKFYGGRGIKFLMTVADFKYLWFRDNAATMEKPSIEREDPDGNYKLSNCKYIEFKDNLKSRRKRGYKNAR